MLKLLKPFSNPWKLYNKNVSTKQMGTSIKLQLIYWNFLEKVVLIICTKFIGETHVEVSFLKNRALYISIEQKFEI